MEFTFEYNNGKLTLYDGAGENKKEVDFKNLGWPTSHQFTYVAKQILESFEKNMRILSKEPGYDGRNQGLVGKLTLELSAPILKTRTILKHPL